MSSHPLQISSSKQRSPNSKRFTHVYVASASVDSKNSMAPARTENSHGPSRSRGETARATPAAPLGAASSPIRSIAPAGLPTLEFIAYPVISVFYYSLQNYNPTKPWRNGFAGFDNFTHAFTSDPQFWGTLTFSAKWVFVEVGLTALRARARADRQPDLRGTGRRPRAGLPGPSPCADLRDLGAALQLPDRITRYLADAGIGQYGTSWLSDTSTVFPAAVVANPLARCPLLRDPDPRRPPVRLQGPVRGRRGRRRQPLQTVPAHHAART